MKNLPLLLCVIALLTSCSSDDSPKSHRLDPNATILLKPDKSAFHTAQTFVNAADPHDRPEDEPGHYSTDVPGDKLSPLEIVKQAGGLLYIPADDIGDNYTFSPKERDFDTPCLKMFGDVIINQEGELVYHFIDARDVVVFRYHNFFDQAKEYKDTIAYLPNSVLQQAAPKIKAAYNKGDYDEVYKLFHEAYTFRPITGEKWEALKEKGEQ